MEGRIITLWLDTISPFLKQASRKSIKRVFVAYWFMVKIPFILTLLIQSILTPYGLFTCAVDKIKSEAGMAVLIGGGTPGSC